MNRSFLKFSFLAKLQEKNGEKMYRYRLFFIVTRRGIVGKLEIVIKSFPKIARFRD